MNKIIFLTLFSLCLHATCYAQEWPEIAPVSGKVVFIDPEHASLDVTITDGNRTPLYTLTCRSAGAEEDKDFFFSGLLHCRLVALYPDGYVNNCVSSLLAEEIPQTADWEGRARFMLNNVVGECAATPDWGAERTFLLRRMRIRLGIHNVKLIGNMQQFDVAPYTFTYSITPDESAVTPIASKSKIPEPLWFNRLLENGKINAPEWLCYDGICVRDVLKSQ